MSSKRKISRVIQLRNLRLHYIHYHFHQNVTMSSTKLISNHENSKPNPWRVIVTCRISDEAIQVLKSTIPPIEIDSWDDPQRLLSSAELKCKILHKGGVDAIFCDTRDTIDEELITLALPRLKCISTRSVGYNHINLKACHRHSILVGYTPDVLTETTADTTVGLAINACRRFKEASASIQDGTWGPSTVFGMCGYDVHSSVVGIIGLGRIGTAVAKRLKAFNCTILYTGPSEKPQAADPLAAKYVSLDELLQQSDIVIPLCPLNQHTKGMFNMSKFKKMKTSAVFVNAGRGDLVVQDDLVEALKTKQIFAAGLDVMTPEPLDPNHPLVKLPNCFLLPHIGCASYATVSNIAVVGAKNIVAALSGNPMPHQVNP